MWQIDSLIYVYALAAAAINACCFFMWWEYKTVKSHKVQKNLAFHYKWSTVILVAVLIVNSVILKVSGGYLPNPAHSLFYILVQGAFGYGCTRILKKNYIEKMKEGDKYPFIISSIGDRVFGYVIIGHNWIEASVENPWGDFKFYKERQQVDVTLVSAGSEDREVVVRV